MSWRQLLDADWSRLQAMKGGAPQPLRFTSLFSPRFFSVVLVRTAYVLDRRGWRVAAKIFSLINFVLNGIEVPASLPIGPGLILPHSQGTIIGAGYIGCNVTIYQQVTLGAKFSDFDFDRQTRPHVEDGVVITAGAKIIGPCRIGRYALIGANAVVTSDIPADCIAVGIPARPIKRRSDIVGNA
jgi:serine O-acetyltransferase